MFFRVTGRDLANLLYKRLLARVLKNVGEFLLNTRSTSHRLRPFFFYRLFWPQRVETRHRLSIYLSAQSTRT